MPVISERVHHHDKRRRTHPWQPRNPLRATTCNSSHDTYPRSSLRDTRACSYRCRVCALRRWRDRLYLLWREEGEGGRREKKKEEKEKEKKPRRPHVDDKGGIERARTRKACMRK